MAVHNYNIVQENKKSVIEFPFVDILINPLIIYFHLNILIIYNRSNCNQNLFTKIFY